MSALHDLIRAGMVRYIGASSMWTYQFAAMQHLAEVKGWTKFVSMQNHYNLIYREEEREMNKYCQLTGVGLIPVKFTSPFLPFSLSLSVSHFERWFVRRADLSILGSGAPWHPVDWHDH
jgi:hypothetical protein